ncbi:guanylate kinase [Clostridium sp. MD294]|uniref:guanylate kinase n=1 Tax=Clostridium sp. MD294 TaxID=97138 RepID=UPI0002CACC2A|nr:guanylate kinase [Clostridium sp. MD294]NDO46807.1 guanylate kinase [Clostridium sp. MD294]USF28751.1 Guanylate kinase [Clostridium sp. MD294]
MKKEGMLVIISGPSGSGKGTVVKELVQKEDFALSISATTRTPRTGEIDGVHYYFYSKETFEEMKNQNELLEWAEFCGNYYGTPRKYVEQQMSQGKNVILEIEVQGALQIKKLYSDCILVFLVPPNIKELQKRLTQRGTEDKQTIDRRMNRAVEEMEFVPQYDYIVINDTITETAEAICAIVKAEGMKSSRNINIKEQFI